MQDTAAKINRRLEVVLVSESPRRVLHPLDLGIDRLAGCIGDAMLQVRQDIAESCLQGAGYLDERLQVAVRGPVVPPVKVLRGGGIEAPSPFACAHARGRTRSGAWRRGAGLGCGADAYYSEKAGDDPVPGISSVGNAMETPL